MKTLKSETAPSPTNSLRTPPITRRLVLLGLLALPLLAHTAEFSIDWSTVDGGGGTSTGGVFTVSVTIGQPDAGVMSGGNFTLQGGFWAVIAAVQAPGAPLLSIFRTTTNTVAVTWPGPEAGWRLQATPNLSTSPIGWTELPSPYSGSGTNLLFIEPSRAGSRFYRLRKP